MKWDLKRVQKEIAVFAEFAKEVLGDINGVKELKDCPVEISKRMTSTKGRFEYQIKRRSGKVIGIKPIKIKIAQYLLDNYHDEDIIDVIRHECVHHIVNIYTKSDRGHDEIFKKYCRKLGVSDATYFTAKPKTEMLERPKTMQIKYIGKCTECGDEYPRKVMKRETIHTWLYYATCSKCGGELHVKDLKNKIVYTQNKYMNLDNIIDLENYENML